MEYESLLNQVGQSSCSWAAVLTWTFHAGLKNECWILRSLVLAENMYGTQYHQTMCLHFWQCHLFLLLEKRQEDSKQTGKIVANKYTSNSVKRCLPSKFHQLTKSKALQVQLLAASCSHSVFLYFPRAGGACTRVLQFHVGLKRATNPCHLPTLLLLTTLGQSCHSWAVNITIIKTSLWWAPLRPCTKVGCAKWDYPGAENGQSPQRFSNDSVQMPHVVPPQKFACKLFSHPLSFWKWNSRKDTLSLSLHWGPDWLRLRPCWLRP